MIHPQDLIDRAVARIAHVHPDMDPERLAALADVLRSEFGGEVTRPAKRSSKEREALHAEIRRLWHDRQASSREIAQALGIHRSTVHRVLGPLRDRHG